MVFRDHALSDLIGFQYQRSTPQQAADDLIGRLMQIGKAVEHHNNNRPALVPIILDGENCWEYYPDGGVGFLRALYQNAVQHKMVQPKRICDALEDHPPTDHIRHLSAGSWISHNFGIWIGHHEDNAAWDRLHETRFVFNRGRTIKRVTPQSNFSRHVESLISHRVLIGFGGLAMTILLHKTICSINFLEDIYEMFTPF